MSQMPPVSPSDPVVTSFDPESELPFLMKMFEEYYSGSMHQFILHFNVYDFMFSPGMVTEGVINEENKPVRLNRFLGDYLAQRGFDVVLYYSHSGGFSYLDDCKMRPLIEAIPAEERFRRRDYGQPQQAPETQQGQSDEITTAFTYLDNILRFRGKINGPGEDGEGKQRRIAVILEYLETLAPHEDTPSITSHGQFVVQMMHRWAMNPDLKDHIVIGLTADLGHVASALYTGNSECAAYQIELPVEELGPAREDRPPRHLRSAWLSYQEVRLDGIIRKAITANEEPAVANPFKLAKDRLESSPEPERQKLEESLITTPAELAAKTSGFSYDNLRDLVFLAAHLKKPITVELVQERKREIITAESRDLLEVVTPRFNLDHVAGYEYVKQYMRNIKKAILARGSGSNMDAVIPKGILFLGPPGTGKSFMASALAKETGFNMVKLKNIRNMYVGESERNLNRVLELLTNMEPVIVFVDEVDQALGSRSLGGGDAASGVEQRIFQRILEFMADDDYRGRILWVAASNRPDGIDQALISRFDIVLPFLLPDKSARQGILETTFRAKTSFEINKTEAPDLFEQCIEDSEEFSGRELDTICRRALQLYGENLAQNEDQPVPISPNLPIEYIMQAIQDFRKARDPEEYQLQTLLAIQSTNFYSFLPPDLPQDILREGMEAEQETKAVLDEVKLAQRIYELRENIARRRHGRG